MKSRSLIFGEGLGCCYGDLLINVDGWQSLEEVWRWEQEDREEEFVRHIPVIYTIGFG